MLHCKSLKGYGISLRETKIGLKNRWPSYALSENIDLSLILIYLEVLWLRINNAEYCISKNGSVKWTQFLFSDSNTLSTYLCTKWANNCQYVQVIHYYTHIKLNCLRKLGLLAMVIEAHIMFTLKRIFP